MTAPQHPVYPPYTAEEAERATAAGISLYELHPGSYAHTVRLGNSGPVIGRVTAVTGPCGVYFTAEDPDGNPVRGKHAYPEDDRVTAAMLLMPEPPEGVEHCEKGCGWQVVTESGSNSGFAGEGVWWATLACGHQLMESGDPLPYIR